MDGAMPMSSAMVKRNLLNMVPCVWSVLCQALSQAILPGLQPSDTAMGCSEPAQQSLVHTGCLRL